MLKLESILKINDGVVNHIGDIFRENGISGKVLYVSDILVDELYGQGIRSQISKLCELNCKTVDNNTISFAMALAEQIIATDVKYIVGLGGGRVLDVCKFAAYVSKIPFISIPTAIANDGIASPIAVLKRQDSKPKSLGCARPFMLIIDTLLLQSCPLQLIKAGIGDTISNYMALLDWEYAVREKKDVMNGFAYLMSRTSLDALMSTQFNKIDAQFIRVLVNSIVLSGVAMDFAGSSRPVSGSEHLFSHALDYYSDQKNLHGIQVALGTVAVLKLLNFDYSSVLKYLRRFDVDINPAHLGISQNTFVLCMQKATSMRKNRYTYLESADLRTKTLENLYEELVGELSCS